MHIVYLNHPWRLGEAQVERGEPIAALDLAKGQALKDVYMAVRDGAVAWVPAGKAGERDVQRFAVHGINRDGDPSEALAEVQVRPGTLKDVQAAIRGGITSWIQEGQKFDAPAAKPSKNPPKTGGKDKGRGGGK